MAGFRRFVEAYERREHVFYMDECVFSSGQVKPKVWFHALSGPVVRAKKKVGKRAVPGMCMRDLREEEGEAKLQTTGY